MSSDFFQQVAEASASRQSVYFTPGRYVVRIDDWKEGTSRPPGERPFYALETTVLASDDHDNHPIGSQATCLQMQDTDMAARNIKAYMEGILGVSPDQVDRDLVLRVLSPDPKTGKSPVAGLVVDVVGVPITTKNGVTITKCKFASRDPEAEIPAYEHRSRGGAPHPDDTPF